MNDSEHLALQASMICVLLFILGNAAIIEDPEWFRQAAMTRGDHADPDGASVRREW
jgi:hypothetical protein